MTQLTNAEVIDYTGLPKDIMDSIGTAQGEQFRTVANEFLNAIINKIVYQYVDTFGWNNPFKKYDSYPIKYGDTIENIYIETPKGYEFGTKGNDPFTKATQTAKVLYATINYKMQYQATIEDVQLRRAVLNEYGFMGIIEGILLSLTTAKNLDEYFATIRMLNNPENFGNSTATTSQGVTTYTFEDIELTGTKVENAKKLTDDIVDEYTSMLLPKNSKNAIGVMTASNKEDLLLIVRRDLKNSINLDYLTGVFNLDKVDLIKQIVEVDSFITKYHDEDTNEDVEVGEDLAYMIIDTRGFDNHVALEDSGLIYNPKNKYTNHFMNLWKILAFKRFYNAIAKKYVNETQSETTPETQTQSETQGE